MKDEKIVSMRFDNAQFEKGIKDTIKSLNELDKQLQLKQGTSGIDNLSKSAKKFDTSTMVAGINSVISRLSTMDIIGITTIANLTNSFVNSGKELVKSLTVDPIKTGLQEYETKLGSITTILTNTQSKGTTLDDVNATLAELNTYSDQTIYNFAEMTRNIGTFTAAGVGLKDSATAIKGIANLAAGSGSTSQQASTAMYQLSQALAAGSLKLQDWNSVVNAGMGGELFQKALKATAKGMGKVVDESVPFRESLQSGWITTDVLIKTLDKFSKDESLIQAATQVKTYTQLVDTMKESVQSGWSVSWEHILGNKDEAAKLFTGLNDGFGKIAGASADARNNMLEYWHAMGGRETIIESLGNTFRFLSKILNSVKDGFREVFPKTTGPQLLAITTAIRDVTRNFKMADETADKIKTTFKGLFSVISIGADIVGFLVKAIFKIVGAIVPCSGGIFNLTSGLSELIIKFKESLDSSKFFEKMLENVANIVPFITIVIDGLINALKGLLGGVGINFDPLIKNLSKFSIGMDETKKSTKKATESMIEMKDTVIKTANPVIEKISEVAKTVKDCVIGFVNNFSWGKTALIASGGLFGWITIVVGKFIKSLPALVSSLSRMANSAAGVLDGVKDVLKAYQKDIQSKTLLRIAAAVGILAGAIWLLSKIPVDQLIPSLIAVGTLIGSLVASMVVFEKVIKDAEFGGIGKLALAMIGLSIAVSILAGAMKKMSDLNWDQTIKGLVSIVSLTAAMAISSKLLSGNTKNMISSAMAMIVFSSAISKMVDIVKELGAIDTKTLIKGIGGVLALCGTLVLFLKTADLDGISMQKGLGIKFLAQALTIMAESVSTMGAMNMPVLIQGLTSIGVLLGSLGVFFNVVNTNGAVKVAIGITIVGAALKILSNVIQELGNTDVGVVIQGLGAMAVILGVLVIALNAMTGTLAGSAAIGVAALALGVLAPILLMFGNMEIEAIGRSLLMLAGAFTVIGIASAILTPIAPAMLVLSLAIGALGISLMAIGAGVTLFSASMVALAAAGVAGTGALVLFITKIAETIPVVAKHIADGIVLFVSELGKGASIIAGGVGKIVIAIVTKITEGIPIIAASGVKMVLGLLNSIVSAFPKIVKAGIDLIFSLIKGISDNIYRVSVKAIEIVVNFISAVASMIGKVINAGIKLMVSFINGLADGIRNNTDIMVDAIWNLVSAILEAMVKFITGGIDTLLNTGKKLMDDGFIKGLVDAGKGLFDVGANFVQGIVDGIFGTLGDIADVGKKCAQSMLDSVKKALDINSPSRIAQAELGEMFSKGIVKGVEKIMPDVESVSTKTGESMPKAAAKGIRKGKPEVKAATKEVAKSAFEVFKEYVDERKYYNEMGLKEELKAWEQTQAKYKVGTAERKESDREVYRLKKELASQEFNNSKSWIDDRKYYNELSLQEELEAWERVQKRYKAGTAERKEADREVYRLKKELISINEESAEKERLINEKLKDDLKMADSDYAKNCIQVEEDLKTSIESTTKAYEEAVKARESAIYTSFGLFDEIKARDKEASKAEMAKNLNDQLNELKQWTSNISNLENRNMDSGLLDELRQLGPKSLSELKALNSMSSSEMDAYVSMWRQKHELASTQSLKELEGLRESTDITIQNLRDESEKKLSDYELMWQDSHLRINEASAAALDDLNTETANKLRIVSETTDTETKNAASKAISNSETLRNGVTTTMSKTVEAVKTILSTPKWDDFGRDVMKKIANGISVGALDAVSAAKNSISKIGFAIQESINSLSFNLSPITDFDTNRSIGSNVISHSGIKSSTPHTQQPKQVNYYQNNYSPKALTSGEIYRQTNNLLRRV